MSRGTLRVGNCSGFYGDRLSAMREMLEGGDLDVLTGDYLAELTMLILGRDRARNPDAGYARTFLTQLTDCLALALDKNVKIVSNAGGVNPAGLVSAIRKLGVDAKIALVRGDELKAGEHAYLGAFGIAEALRAGADLVVTGRVTDASLVVGPAIAHFGWSRTDLDALAGATVAGHLLECGTQSTGGNYAFFTEIADPLHPGFPLAEIEADGSCVLTKHPGTGGAVTVGTVTAQLVYEIGDARYAGPDVTTRLDTVDLSAAGPDRVRVSRVRGEPPPPALKVSRTALGGFRNELTVVLTGLDIDAKAALFRRQFEAAAVVSPAEVTWTLARLDHPDAPTEQQASALLTVVARDPGEGVAGRAFVNPAIELALGSYPGFFTTTPPGGARPYGVFTPGFVPRSAVSHEVVLPDGSVRPIAPPATTRPLEPWTGAPPAPLTGGATRRLPLGTVVGARSGDKGGSANVGLWVRGDDAYAWMAAMVTEREIRALLPEAADLPVTITYLPNLRAVNVVIDGLLGEGVAYNARFDPQAKGLSEWLRSRLVDIPESLLEDSLPEEQA
ncbi:acyclic terpene utilization AtuA family protein [Actinoplanes sp. NPDC051411]|uniref:acyclic terpene utilization AtuA family protein n=1 Tax=Actinoplanes sp. NPDC051411 TaxID=3155522 RepID=UPI003420FBB3